jgi:RES domain-containing protein
MSSFVSIWDYVKFAQYIRKKARFFINEDSKIFLKSVLETALERQMTLVKGEDVWRSQLGIPDPIERDHADGTVTVEFHPYNAERMKPLTDSAVEGRANAQGVPFLYVAADPETAMSETRPNLAAEISLARLSVLRDLKLVDCCKDAEADSPYAFNGEVPEEKREAIVWGSISSAFSRPVNLTGRHADYAPTQILAEYFRGSGYDGIRYHSSLRQGGFNFVFFDIDDAEVREVKIYRVEAIEMKFRAMF